MGRPRSRSKDPAHAHEPGLLPPAGGRLVWTVAKRERLGWRLDEPGNGQPMNRKQRRRLGRTHSVDVPIGEALSHLLAHFQAGRLEDALAVAGRILQSSPDEPDVLHLAAVIDLRLGRGLPALARAERLLGLDPGHDGAALTRAEALFTVGRAADAATAYRRLIETAPGLPERAAGLHINLGRALRATGDFDGAAGAFQQALALRPGMPEALLSLGDLAHSADMAETAVDLFRQAIQARPDYAEAWNNLGNALAAAGAADPAADALRRAVVLRPDFAEAHNNLGNVLRGLGDFAGAIASYRRAIELRPTNAAQRVNLGHALFESGRPAEALAAYEAALKLEPGNDAAAAFRLLCLQDLCDWGHWDAALGQLDRATRAALAAGRKTGETPFIHIARCDDAAANLDVARSWSRDLERRAAAVTEPFAGIEPAPGDGRIRLGYMTSDFREHALMHLMRTTIGLHDRQDFIVYLYAIGPDDGSDHRKRAEADADVFVDLTRLDDIEAARRIRADGIDIFVDLKGYTQGARLGITALRPAPLQVSYMGFPGSMGAAFFDYVLADAVVAPADQAAAFSETLAWMPYCYMVTDHTQPIAANRPTRADEGLPDDAFVFCSFNRAAKFDPLMFDAWMRILQKTPGSVLWLFVEDLTARANLQREARVRGVDPARLVFAGRRPKADHLARIGLADLGLDTRLYGGHTTTCDTLWAGVPVVTVKGRHFASRASASILAAAGLPDLITERLEDFETLAERLAADPATLAALRARLGVANAALPLFDTPRWVRDWENLLRQMWRRHRAGAGPQPLRIEAA